MLTREEKLLWGRTLKVGDVVCDCRYRHSIIVSIEPDYNTVNIFPKPEWLPDWLFDLFIDIELFAEKYLHIRRIIDYEIETDDGHWCSLLNCCDPPWHEEEHPQGV